MLSIGSHLDIVDNSGAKIAKCLKNLKKINKQTVSVGDIIIVVLKNIKNRKKIAKRIIYIGLVVGIKYWLNRKDGSLIRFFNNCVLIYNKQFKFLGSRVYSIILKEVKIKLLKCKKYRTYFKRIIMYNSFII